MGVFDWIRLIAGSAFLVFGLVIFFTEVFGAFHFQYVLNRMHVAAMGDTLGIASSLIGLIIFSGINFTSLKLLLIIVFLWFASPVSSHVLARLEVATNENLESYCEVYTDIESLEAELVTEAGSESTVEEAELGIVIEEEEFESEAEDAKFWNVVEDTKLESAAAGTESENSMEAQRLNLRLQMEGKELSSAIAVAEFENAVAETESRSTAAEIELWNAVEGEEFKSAAEEAESWNTVEETGFKFKAHEIEDETTVPESEKTNRSRDTETKGGIS